MFGPWGRFFPDTVYLTHFTQHRGIADRQTVWYAAGKLRDFSPVSQWLPI